MPRPKILSVIGTRPEAIKMAPVIRAVEESGEADHRLALTGQHTSMVDQVLSVFDISADYDLELMTPGQSLYDIGGACLAGLREVVADFDPDVTVVQGDTATVFFASLVTFFEQGGLAHVEAGLRSGEKWAPFPEEMLRRMTDTLADYCFAPTLSAACQLKAEGVPGDRIFVTGNPVVDALQAIAAQSLPVRNRQLAGLIRSGRRLALLTAHRRESFGKPLEGVFHAVNKISQRFPDLAVLYPVHPNPQVREPAGQILGATPGVCLTGPLAYGDLLAALRHADLVLTDSGGIQEEAPAFGTHVLVLRDVTERPEGVEAGVATLVGTDPSRVLAEAVTRLEDSGNRANAPNPYGDGQAGKRIADILIARLSGRKRELRDWTGP